MASNRFDTLATEVAERRTYGKVWVHRSAAIIDDETAQDRADQLVASLDLRPIGGAWISISRSDAHHQTVQVLERDLAYGVAMMSEVEADRLAAEFLDCFGDSAVYLTNSEEIETGRTWTPITTATIDRGIVAVAPAEVGLLWVADND